MGVAHESAEIATDEVGILIGHYIRQTGALGGFGSMLNAVIESTHECLGEVRRVRIRRLDGVSLVDGETVVAGAH
jgi:hypothetical protein